MPRAWVSIDATMAGRTIRFYSTHLETNSVPQVQTAQGAEMIQHVLASPHPVVLAGDFNSDAGGATTTTYASLVAAGLVDVYGEANPGALGHTGSQQEDVRSPSTLNRRIDLVFTRSGDGLTSLYADVVGEEETDRTPSGLWPSDHAGVIASVILPTVVPF
jgi:endonuclease/exonuclease/phosphatase family metal-dependent hydrolase